MSSQLDDWKYDSNSNWLKQLQENAEKNRKTVEAMAEDHSLPLNYYAAYTPVSI